MTALAFVFIVTAASALIVASAGPKSFKAAMTVCAAIALVGWAASYPIVAFSTRFGSDVYGAEEYFDAFSARVAAAEIAVALVWTLLWFATARIALLVIRHVRKFGT